MARVTTKELIGCLLLGAALTSACGGDDSGEGGSGGTGSGGAGAGSGAAGSGTAGVSGNPGDGGLPLLERPSASRYDCSTVRPAALFELPWNGFALVPGTNGARLAVAESYRGTPPPNRSEDRVTWSTLDVNGALGSPTVLRAPSNRFVGSVAAAGDGAVSTIVWTEPLASGTSYSLNAVQVDAADQLIAPASTVLQPSMPSRPRIVRAGSGYALLWVENTGSSAKLSFGLLDERARLTQAPVVLEESRSLAEGDIAVVGERFVVSYSDYEHYESGRVARLLVLGSDGSALGDPIVFEDSAATGFASTVPSLLARGDEVLAAWSVVSGDAGFEAQEAATTIRVARFDAAGGRVTPLYDLQRPVMDVENVQPFWIDMGDDVGLLWAEGNIIYVCGGCVPDHSLRFVVLDGETMLPQSQVAKIENTLPAGGLLFPTAVGVGDDVLVVSTVTYHTSGEGASATLRCVER